MQTMMKQLNMPEAEDASDEFIEAELEMLSMGAKGIPQGTALGESKHLSKHLSFAMRRDCRLDVLHVLALAHKQGFQVQGNATPDIPSKSNLSNSIHHCNYIRMSM